MSRSLTVVLCDLDETLIDESPNVKAGYRAAAQYAADCFPSIDTEQFIDLAPVAVREIWWQPDWLGPITERYGLSAWDGLSEEFRGPHRELDQLRDWLPDYRLAAWRNVFSRFDITAPRHVLDETVRAFSWGRHKGRVRLARGVAEMLPALGNRAIGVVTNGPADGQEEKIHRAGLGRLLKAVVASTAAGVGKPDPALVTMCLEAMGHSRMDEVVIIGDSLERDIQLAQNAGVPAVWITPSPPPAANLPPTVVAVAGAADVAHAIARLEQR